LALQDRAIRLLMCTDIILDSAKMSPQGITLAERQTQTVGVGLCSAQPSPSSACALKTESTTANPHQAQPSTWKKTVISGMYVLAGEYDAYDL
jgi:hypothetical protein